MRKSKVYIVGVAPEGASSLSPINLQLVKQAELVLGGERLLDMFPSVAGEKVSIKNNLAELARLIKSNLGLRRMVVLASGDPNFFGVAKYLTAKLGADVIEIVPNVSAMQVAFARIKESWDDARMLSAHARSIQDVVAAAAGSDKVAILTDNRNTPAAIARALVESGLDCRRAYVCQDLGSKQERIIKADVKQLCNMEFSPLAIMILVRDGKAVGEIPQQPFGIPEAEFSQKNSLITKLEVRAVSLARLKLNEWSIVWDIGAGSGAVCIEASSLAKNGHVFAVEKDVECVAHIKENIKKFTRANVTVVHALAPDGLKELPDPTAVFVGGSGGKMASILRQVCRRLKLGGRVVINVTTLENLHYSVRNLEDNGFDIDITLINIARSKAISDLTRLEPLNPVFVITGKRAGEVN